MRGFESPISTADLLLAPYEQFTPINAVEHCPDRGVVVVWRIVDAAAQASERDWILARPPRVSLIVVLPAASAIRNALSLVRDAGKLRPRGVLPNSGVSIAEPIRLLLGSAPRDLATMAVAHLTERGLLRTHSMRALVKRIFDMAATVPSISLLSRKLYTSRRTLGRAFECAGLPVPSHWLQLARLLHVAALIQEKRTMPIARAAVHVRYPDGFTMSNQMKRLIGCRPTDVREHLGLAWVLEDWMYQERIAGRLLCDETYPGYLDVNEWIRNHPLRRRGK